MRLPIEWLKDYVSVLGKPEALAVQLTMAGHEVTAIHESDAGPVLELEITPNRADCLSILGLAREMAAVTGQPLKRPGHRARGMGQGKGLKTRPTSLVPRPIIRIEDRKGCVRYIGRVIEGVKVGPSPAWMQQRLAACGIRAINNIVDATNYVLLEYGQPLHAFDWSKLAQGTIVVRRAKPNETVITLDDIKRTLTADTLVIADATRPIAIAGIMGGMGSEVTSTTTSVLLESAFFDPISIRRTGRRLGLASESSYRFERGVDPVGVENASVRAADLITQVAGGRETALADVGTKPRPRLAIVFETSRAAKWLGAPLNSTTTRGMFARLSCRVSTTGSGDTQRVEPPTFRRDLTHDVDLYEEIARLTGYDRLPARVPVAPIASGSSEATAAYGRLQSLRCLCASLGLAEAITWALVSEAELTRVGYAPTNAARVSNPLSQDHAWLRPSLTMGLLAAVRRNATQGAPSIRLFEVGNVFVPVVSHQIHEAPRVGIALSGAWTRGWAGTTPSDFFRLKGLIDALMHTLCDGTPHYAKVSLPWAEPGQAARVVLNHQPVGVLGQVSGSIVSALDLQDPIWIGEVFVDVLLKFKRGARVLTALAPFPPVKRDMSILVDDQTPYERLVQTIREVGGSLAADVELIDRYAGKQVPRGKHSFTFSIDYRDPARTLAAAEVEAVHQRIVQVLAEQFGASLR